jgi:hypothetical protein
MKPEEANAKIDGAPSIGPECPVEGQSKDC